MTIRGFQSYSYSAIRLSLTVTPSAAATSTAKAPAANGVADRVTLSADASSASSGHDLAATAANSAEELPPDAPVVPPPLSRAARRAEALFAALDGDVDGTITEDEFKDGALKLLRRAGARRRFDDASEGEGRETRGLGRLERKIERAFDRVDKNDDGAIDKDELTAALARGGKRGGAAVGPPPAASSPSDSAVSGVSAASISISVTYVSIAVQRYASVQGAGASEASVLEAPRLGAAVPTR